MPQNEIDSIVKAGLLRRYLGCAIGSSNDVPWHIASQLLETGLFKMKEDNSPEIESFLQVLKIDNDFALKHSFPLFLLDEKQSKGNEVEYKELTELLSWRNLSAAKLIAPCIKRTIDRYVSSNYIHSLVDAYIDVIKSNELPKIIQSASKLDEALVDSWDWQVTILKQASREGIHSIVERQIPRLLGINPAAPTVLTYLQNEFDDALNVLISTDEQSTIDVTNVESSLCKLGPRVGHLPWRSDIGFGSILKYDNMTSDHKSSYWSGMESWLCSDNPAWWFHVWLISVTHPSIVPKSAWPDIWHKVCILLGASFKGYEQEFKNTSKYTKLLEFFIYRLETSLPTARSDFVFWCSSKLASDVVSSSLPDDDIDEIISQALDDEKIIWQISSPTFATTSIRSVFITFQEYWSSAIQSSITEWDLVEVKKYVPKDVIEVMENLIRKQCTKLSIPEMEVHKSISPLIMTNLTTLHDEWKSVLNHKDIKDFIDARSELLNKYSTPDSVIEKLNNSSGKEDFEEIVALSRLHGFIINGQISSDQILELVSSENWNCKAEPSIPLEYITHIVDAILRSQWIGNDNLHVEFPHWAAQQCLFYLGDDKRRDIYLEATILLSMKGNTSSAITRLIYEDKNNMLKESFKVTRYALSRMLTISPSWVSGRIRCILATLAE